MTRSRTPAGMSELAGFRLSSPDTVFGDVVTPSLFAEEEPEPAPVEKPKAVGPPPFRKCGKGKHRPIRIDCKRHSGHDGPCSIYTLAPLTEDQWRERGLCVRYGGVRHGIPVERCTCDRCHPPTD